MTRLLFIFIGIFTVSCNSNKTVFEKNPPFSLQKATYQHWFAGVQEAGRGVRIELIFEEIQSNIKIENIYFGAQKLHLVQDRNDQMTFRASATFPPKEDLIMDSNSVMELNNPRPSLVSDDPFQLQPDEAVITYELKGKTYHYKLLLEKREAIAYPSSKPVDNN